MEVSHRDIALKTHLSLVLPNSRLLKSFQIRNILTVQDFLDKEEEVKEMLEKKQSVNCKVVDMNYEQVRGKS